MTLLNKAAGSDVFLQGSYLNLAINSGGSIGSFANAPKGIYTDLVTGYARLGMWADFDGFGAGKASPLADSLLKGTPVEGFSLGYSAGSSQYVRTNHDQVGTSDIAGSVSDVSTATAARARWTGTTSEKVAVDQIVTLTEDGKYVRFDVTLTNASSAAVANVRYMRTSDPDQGGGFATENKIVQQGSGSALITAAAAGAQMFYYSGDTRAVVSTYGLDNTNPYATTAYATPQAQGYSIKGDYAINLTFAVGTLAAGGSTTLTFYTGLTDDITAALAAINSGVTPTKPTNVAPVANDDLFSLVASASVTGNVLANDRDADGDTLTAAVRSGPTNGTLTLSSDGTFRYVPKTGFVGTDSFTYAASDGKASDAATVRMVVAPVPTVNSAPVARDDAFAVAAGIAATGNVLTNDRDADGDTLGAAVRTGPSNGKLTLNDDGSFRYVAKAGFSGVDSFTYASSDGDASDVATVKITVAAAPPPTTPPVFSDPVLSRAGTQDVSAEGNQIVTGRGYHNSFFVDAAAASGNDRVTNFENNDVLVTTGPLVGLVDGLLALTKNRVLLDGAGNSDIVRLTGVDTLRSLGMSASGLSVYANGAVRPADAIEGTLAADRLSGDVANRKAETFFFDTALDLDLGADSLVNFGTSDILVTTTAIYDGNKDRWIAFGSDNSLDLAGGTGGPDDTITPGDGGHVAITDVGGGALAGLEYDGTIVRGGVSYYVYSMAGSSAGLTDLTF